MLMGCGLAPAWLLMRVATAQNCDPALHDMICFRNCCICTSNAFKNAAKRSRQHAGKKYQEYAQRRVCFVNEKISFALVVFAWKCRLFCLFAHGQCRVYYIYHVEFHFRFEHLITFPVWYQLSCGCWGERSSKKISGNILLSGWGK